MPAPHQTVLPLRQVSSRNSIPDTYWKRKQNRSSAFRKAPALPLPQPLEMALDSSPGSETALSVNPEDNNEQSFTLITPKDGSYEFLLHIPFVISGAVKFYVMLWFEQGTACEGSLGPSQGQAPALGRACRRPCLWRGGYRVPQCSCEAPAGHPHVSQGEQALRAARPFGGGLHVSTVLTHLWRDANTLPILHLFPLCLQTPRVLLPFCLLRPLVQTGLREGTGAK